jgi:hypothetical protein
VAPVAGGRDLEVAEDELQRAIARHPRHDRLVERHSCIDEGSRGDRRAETGRAANEIE